MKQTIALVLFAVGAVLAALGQTNFGLACVSAGLFVGAL